MSSSAIIMAFSDNIERATSSGRDCMPLFTYRVNVKDIAAHATRADEADEGHAVPAATTTTQFAVNRIAAAFVLLAFVFGAGVYCAHDPMMKDWSPVLLHTFELLLGGMVGIIIGEKTAGAP
jgi:hypothetical protein